MRGAKLGQEQCVQARPHPGLGPFPKSAPAGDAAASDRLGRNITPAHIGAQDEQDATERDTIVDGCVPGSGNGAQGGAAARALSAATDRQEQDH